MTAPQRARAWLALPGVAIGFVGALVGIGGGFFAVPLLHYGARLPLRVAVASALLVVLATSLSSTATELLHPRTALSLEVFAWLAAGGLLGAQLGYTASRLLPARALKAVFAAFLVAAAVRLVLAAPAAAPTGGAPDLTSWSARATVALVGLGGGFLAPLLGIGGGILVVPALVLACPELGYLGARAAALALAVLTSLRSLALYRHERVVDLPRGLALAAGALLGAVLGTLTVHRPGWDEAARYVLAAVLASVAVRLVRDVLVGVGAPDPSRA